MSGFIEVTQGSYGVLCRIKGSYNPRRARTYNPINAVNILEDFWGL